MTNSQLDQIVESMEIAAHHSVAVKSASHNGKNVRVTSSGGSEYSLEWLAEYDRFEIKRIESGKRDGSFFDVITGVLNDLNIQY